PADVASGTLDDLAQGLEEASWQLDSDTEQIVTSSHAHLLSAVDALLSQANRRSQQCSELMKRLQSVEAELAKAGEKSDRLQRRVEELEGERADWNESRLSQLEEISRADRMLSSYASAENDLQTANSRLAGERDDAAKRVESLEVELAEARAQLVAMEGVMTQLGEASASAGDEKIKELLESNLALTEARRELESQLNRKSAEHESLLAQAETQQQQHEAEQEQLQAEKEDLCQQLRALDAQLKKKQRFVEEQIAEREAEREEFQAEIQRLNDEAKELRAVAVAAAAQAVDAKVGVEDDLNGDDGGETGGLSGRIESLKELRLQLQKLQAEASAD
uniref:Kinesin motor domain-containing protein n=1 Tax=Macrostomum lignano TaxID=282301 RepID=A0A1I8FTK3_9PLAT